MGTKNQHAQQLDEVQRASALQQEKFNAFAATGTGMTVRGYRCDPTNPPDFDPKPWARSTDLPVWSEDNYNVGEITPEGYYRHFGVCKK